MSNAIFPVIFAVAIPMLAECISLIGAFSLSAVAFIFPPIMDLLTKWPNQFGKYNWIVLKNILIILFGFFSMIVGTIAVLYDIYNKF